MTEKAVLLRLNEQKKAAKSTFENNLYITIHDYSNSSDSVKRDPFSVWVDLNYPVYALVNGKIVYKPEGVKNCCIKYSGAYPEVRPDVYVPVDLASIHAWENPKKISGMNYYRVCLHTKYVPDTHNLIQEISNLMTLAANCPECINYFSSTPDHRSLIDWTKKSIETGILPTVEYKELFRKTPTATRRRAYSVTGVL